ncbi:response regulator transcription factor [Dactylosporangium sp. AC04546]|uniref:response regulator n=1 Tax=Dactylosporangium sp. AC04546 TaxID=2862460 RepID=UPI001EDF35F6|nr:response regulator transcription factor [Dactylosporangium sp. AC04546]WVK82445.1 response regulator transcription factor [Dactylosporangium sp. AC04546]
MSVTVLVVDDNPVVREALRGFLDADEATRVVGEAGNGQEALALAQRHRPDVTLLDHRMPIADGLSIVTELARLTAVLALTSDASPAVIGSMLRGGARGYLVHGQFDPPELLRAVLAVAGGQGWLSPVAASVATSALRSQGDAERGRAAFGLTDRERDVLDLLSAGLSNAAIAGRLRLTEKTVKNHLYNIFTKLRVSSRTEAVVRWAGPFDS